MMKLHHLMENFDLARFALEHYPHDESSLPHTLPFFRISANAVYPYRHNNVLCFLRLAPADEKKTADIEAEIQFIQALRRQGFPAMQPIAALDGRFVLPLATPWGVYTASSFAAVPGRPMEDTACTPAMLHKMGSTLARLHLLSRNIHVQRPDHREMMTCIRRQLTENNAPAAILDAWQHIDNRLQALPVNPETYGLLHYDFEPDNVFWHEETKSCAVIDFDDALYGWFSMDVEQALNALQEITDDTGCAAFMDGYRSISPFTAAMEAQRPLMRAFINLRSYARLLHCLNDPMETLPPWMPGLIEKLNRKKEQLEAWLLSERWTNLLSK